MDATTMADSVSADLDQLEDDHQVQRALCRDLEAIADALPDAPSPDTIRRVGERIERVAALHFPRALALLGTLPADCAPSPEEFAILAAMQANDATHGEDLVVALWRHVRRDPGVNAVQLGYMLRCYFDGCRRAIAFKESLLARARTGTRH